MSGWQEWSRLEISPLPSAIRAPCRKCSLSSSATRCLEDPAILGSIIESVGKVSCGPAFGRSLRMSCTIASNNIPAPQLRESVNKAVREGIGERSGDWKVDIYQAP